MASLCLVVLLAYSNSFGGGFVLDSRALILDDARVQHATAENIDLIVSHSYWWPRIETELYRPVTTLSYLFNYAVLGNADRPEGYHVVNLVLHAANVLLVYALAFRISGRFWFSLLLAGIWGVHPLSTEAVTNIVGRADLLATVGVGGALFAYLKSRVAKGRNRALWYLVALIATTIGVFSKENAVAVVGVAFVYEVVVASRQRPRAGSAWSLLVFVPPLWLLWLQRASVLSETPADIPFVDNPIVGAGFWQGRLTALAVIPRYLGLFLWPRHLSPDYSFQQIPIASGAPRDWFAWIIVLSIFVAGILLWRVSRRLFFALAASAILFLPVSNLVFPIGTIMAERFAYLPSIGIAAVVVATTLWAAERFRVKWIGLGLLIFCAVMLGSRTWVRNRDWSSELSLWSAAVKTAPRSFKTHSALAEALYQSDPTRANLDQVIAEKEISVALLASVPDPTRISAQYRELATYYLEQGEWLQQHQKDRQAQEAAYRHAVSAAQRFLSLADSATDTPVKDRVDGNLILATAAARLGEEDIALRAGRRAMSLNPFASLTYRTVASTFSEASRHDAAAVVLLTGFMVTGDAALRSSAIELYRSGLDPAGCATSQTPTGVVLNSSCEIVRLHVCASAAAAMDIQRQSGHPDLAAQIEATTRKPLRCETAQSMLMKR